MKSCTYRSCVIEKINKNGGKIKKAVGVNEDMIRTAVQKHNVVKINSDTDLRLAMTGCVREVLKNKQDEFDPRKYIGAGQKEIANVQQYYLLGGNWIICYTIVICLIVRAWILIHLQFVKLVDKLDFFRRNFYNF